MGKGGESTMNTTAAATQAGVTVATIRTWCRRGVIAAVKQAGRWIIDATSLTRRIEIGARHMTDAGTYTVYYRACRHSETKKGPGRDHDIIGYTCNACTADRKARQAASDADGGYATPRQLDYLASLTGKTRADYHGMTKGEASRRIDAAKSARPIRRSYGPRCECASGRHGGVCTC
jgi:hypothetical protein